ncbi:MAG TPA: lactate utilization protein B, partial [Anaerolineales bacterium]|nr:lactate utilization protein B [Anaerolineales bacterium]
MSSTFRARVRSALANEALQEALDRNADRRKAAWEAAFDSLPGAQESRREARRIRAESLDRLDDLLAEFRRNLEANGFQVHVAADADQACGQVVAIARAHGARLAAKSKSMVSEEIGLNAALQRAGIRAVETDLGEFIVQLRDEPPAHIITPAIHLRRQDVGRTLSEKLGVPFTTDVSEMTAAARAALRKVFLEADIGISGVNFGVAETGTLCLITNEGNGRFVTTVPPVHIALMGMERLVPTLSDLARMLEVLPRAATGQNISSYVTLLHSPRRRGDAEGPLERHILLIDNGRLRLRQSAIAEALVCVRCGACLNACPVYREAGGHAYGSVYPGPIGSVVSPGLFGLAAFGHLASASTLCGACREACPVDIDLPGLLLRVRNAHHEASPRAGIWKSSAMRVFTWVMTSPGRYRLAQRLAAMSMRLLPRTSGWIRWLPPPLATWTRRRAFPAFASVPFRSRWPSLVVPSVRRAAETTQEAPPQSRIPSLSKDAASMALGKSPLERFEASLTSVGGELVRTNSESLVDDLLAVLDRSKVGSILAAREIEADMTRWLDALR